MHHWLARFASESGRKFGHIPQNIVDAKFRQRVRIRSDPVALQLRTHRDTLGEDYIFLINKLQIAEYTFQITISLCNSENPG